MIGFRVDRLGGLMRCRMKGLRRFTRLRDGGMRARVWVWGRIVP